MELRCLQDKGPRSKLCSIEPVTTAALIAGGSSLLGSGLSFMGQSSSSKAVRAAMERYLQALQQGREEFLAQPETRTIRKTLRGYAGGRVGIHPEALESMKAGVYEDYGKSLSDMSRLTRAGGAGASGVYTPGRSDRIGRLLGQNIAANRANTMRDITQRNAETALSNVRFAASALPTYLPGIPSTVVPSPDVFLRAGETPSAGSFLGPGVANAGQQYANLALYAPIMQRMMSDTSSPYSNFMLWQMMNNSPGRLNLGPTSVYPTS